MKAGEPVTGRPAVAVIAIFGPTASGKSAVAEAVADELGTDVVSADALQVYRGLPILTNQPERATRLVGIRSLDEQMTVGEFAPLAHDEIDALVAASGRAVVAGGTGLYLRAALTDLEVPPAVDDATLARVERRVGTDRAAAHGRLATLDPIAAATIHPNDRQRLVRALALAESGASLAGSPSRLWADDTRLPTALFGLAVDPQVLERRIRARTADMFARGVTDEVRAALDAPLSRTMAKALGLREIATLPPAEAEERLVRRTRRYAAYQRKWMRRIPNIRLVDGDRTPERVASEIIELVQQAACSRVSTDRPRTAMN
jgi:tRNA dimethylallyltransferase